MNRNYATGIFYCLISAVSLGPGMAFVKMIDQPLPPTQILFLRGIIVLAGVSLILNLNGRLTKRNLKVQNFWPFLINSFAWSIGSIAFYMAITRMDFAILNAITMLGPIITSLLSSFFLGERLSKMQQAGILLAFAGVLFCVLPKSEGNNVAIVSGIFLALIRTIAYSSGSVLNRYLAQRESIEVYMIMANLLSLPFALIGIFFQEWIALDTRSIMLIFGFGLMQVLVTFLGAVAIRSVPIAVYSAIGYVQLPASALVGWALFGETLHWLFYPGAAVLVLGLSIVSGLAHPVANIWPRGRINR